MEDVPRSDWKSSLRTIVFAGLAGAILLGLAVGRVGPARERTPQDRARLYRRAGDTYTRLYYLLRRVSEQPAVRVLEEAQRHYWLSVQMDPSDVAGVTSLALVQRALGQREEARYSLSLIVNKQMPLAEWRRLAATYAIVVSTQTRPETVEVAHDFLRGLAPGAMTLAAAYESMDSPDQARQEWSFAEDQGLGLLRSLVVMFAICGPMVLAGLVWLVVVVVARVRSRGAPRAAAEEARSANWGLREAVEALILWVSIGMGLSALLGKLPASGQTREAMLLLLPSVAGGLVAIAWVWIASRRPVRLGWRFSRWWRQVAIGFSAAGLFTIPVLVLYQSLEYLQLRYVLTHQTVQSPLPEEHPLVPLFVAAPGWPTKALLVVAACVVVPLLEETLFRGIFYRALRREWAVAPAALASAAIFAVGHLAPIAVIPYMVLGLLFAYLYERSGSLVAPWAAHGAFNAFNLALLLTLFG